MEGWAVWVTGLPGSGKSTVARALRRRLKAEGVEALILSSDALRRILTPNPTYSPAERDFLYHALVELAKTITLHGRNVIIDATGNRRRYRQRARRAIRRFVEAYVRCNLSTCMAREAARRKRFDAPREVYGRGLRGESATVPGLGAPYEAPRRPEVVVDSERCGPSECAEKIFQALRRSFPECFHRASHGKEYGKR